ncbi:cytochrome P450 [Streptomyces sp. NPDC051130]|uniref:cytochrome P450 n=1 Tax=Streptomyces sp. NPDC051130 TaxID=3157223 RepID=UPI00343C8DA4
MPGNPVVQNPADRLAGPADPLGLRRLSAGLNLLRRPLPFLRELANGYGAVCAMPGRNPRTVFAFGPEQARQVLTGKAFVSDSFRHLRLPPGSPMMLLTSGLLRLNGTIHRKHRQAMQQAFSPRHVAVYTDTIVRFTDDMLERWTPGSSVDLHEELARLVTRISLATMAGLEDEGAARRLNDKMVELAAAAGHPLTAAIQAPLPGTPFRRMTRVAGEIEDILRALIAARRSGEASPDLLSKLTVSDGEPGSEALSDEELLGEAYTALCHDSVASSLFWTLFLLDQHREWWEKLRAEVAEVAGDAAPGPDELVRMPVLDQIVKESVRLMPPAGFGVRYAEEGAAIDGHPIPVGAMVIFSSFVTHRDAATFPEPLRFRPERWETAQPAQHEYFPFGLGQHNCIGRNLALLESKLVLARIMQRAPVVLPEGTVVDPVVRISTVPDGHVRAVVAEPDGPAPRAHRVTGSVKEIIDLPEHP